ncbi:hypothetical protein PENTCL1PPCAC_10927, partial [Pristionchus entomophagus]
QRIRYERETSRESTADSYTFYPTEEQIEDFAELIEKIEQQTHAGSKCGILKIVPPNGWKPREEGYSNKTVGATKITRPVKEIYSSANKPKCFTKDVSVHKKELTWSELQTYAKKNKLTVVNGDLDDRKEIDKLLFESMKKDLLPDPVYGADTEGSLYDEDVTTLNVSHLGTILDDLKSTRITGVTTTYLYFGMWRTMFPWHAEDVDLYSINYLHHGTPKHWWSIPPEAADLFERMMSQLFPDDAAKCGAFLRHKNYIVHPDTLRLYGIPFAITTQRKNEFIITLPRGYHMGYNTGLNIAESTNFASDRWVDFGMNSVLCSCKKEAVHINVEAFVKKYRTEEEHEAFKKYWLSPRIDARRHNAMKIGRNYTLNFTDSMYSKNENNLFVEKQYNELRSKHFPHCAVCETFLPEDCCEYMGQIPDRSRSFVTSNLLSKKKSKSVFDEEEEKEEIKEEDDEDSGRFTLDEPPFDPKEDRVLVCENCKVSVHEQCYSKRSQYDERDEETPWKCMRCCEKDETRIRAATCVLCELRGGALVKALLGSTSTFVHVVCALAHRRSFFFDPSDYLNQVYIHPPPRYEADDKILKLLSEAEYRDLPRKPFDAIANRYQCSICKVHGEGLLVCSACVLEEEEDAEMVHATCARGVGMRMERREYPHLVVLYCHKHVDRLIRLPEGTEIEVGDGRRGRIVGYVFDEEE